MLKPASLDFVHTAAVPLGALTAWQAMFDVAQLTGGQRLLITGTSGGVGSLAGQLAAIRDLVDAGELKAHVSTVLPLAEIKQALELSAGGRTRGKIVLEIAP